MQIRRLAARIDEFALPASTAMDASVAIPTVKGKYGLKYGEHAYYFLNFQTLKGVRVRINHLAIIRPGWKRLRMAAKKQARPLSLFRPLTPRYHYQFNMLEQVMLMTVPHTVTNIGNGRFLVNLWSWCGYVVVEPARKTASYHMIDDLDDDAVLGSQQWVDPTTNEIYAMSYSLSDS